MAHYWGLYVPPIMTSKLYEIPIVRYFLALVNDQLKE